MLAAAIRRIHEALGGLSFRHSDLIAHAGRAASEPSFSLWRSRALDDIRAAEALLAELKDALHELAEREAA